MFAEKNLQQRQRNARTGRARIARARKKILRGAERRYGEGATGKGILVPRGIKMSTPASRDWREANMKAAEKLAFAY